MRIRAFVFCCMGLLASAFVTENPKDTIHNTAPNNIPIGSTISYQLHSYNDLREWPQVLRKGAVSIKIDPQYAPSSFCSSQPRVNHSEPRGCLLLNHDPVVDTNWYFTLDDVLAFVTDPNNAAYFRGGVTFQIALCFKGNGGMFGPCDGTKGANDWLSLVDDFFEEATTAVVKYGLNITFVLDGDADPGLGACVTNRWRPWVATYTTGRDADAAFVSNDASKGYDRYQVLNEDVSHWAFAVNNSFGKFVNSTHPYQCWEPSDQPTILSLAGQYVQRGLEHVPDMRFAVNIDVAQFESYAGNLTQRAWNSILYADGYASSPTTTILSDLGSPYAYPVMVLTTFAVGSKLMYITYGSHAPRSTLSALAALPFPTLLPAPAAASTWTVANNGSAYVLTAQIGDAGLVTLARSLLTTKGELAPVNESSITFSGNILSVAISACGAGDFCVTAVLNQTALQNCQLALEVLALSGKTIAVPTCLMSSAAVMPLAAANAALQSAADGVLLHAISYTSNNTMYGATACTSLSTGQTTVNSVSCWSGQTASPAGASVVEPLATHVGSQPSIALAWDGSAGAPVVLEVHGEGYCPNNEAQNKNAYTKLCDQKPVYTGGEYLNYNYGQFQNWGSQLLAGNLSSPCSATMLHGMFGMGAHPSTALFSFGGTTNVAVVVEGAGGTPADPNDCGVVSPAVGLQLYGWPTFPVS